MVNMLTDDGRSVLQLNTGRLQNAGQKGRCRCIRGHRPHSPRPRPRINRRSELDSFNKGTAVPKFLKRVAAPSPRQSRKAQRNLMQRAVGVIEQPPFKFFDAHFKFFEAS
jgi:hypothetical protein